jgi:hypothetical protein
MHNNCTSLMSSVVFLGATTDVTSVRTLLESPLAVHSADRSIRAVDADCRCREDNGRCVNTPTCLTSLVIPGEPMRAMHPTGGSDVSALISLLVVLHFVAWIVTGADLTAFRVHLVAGDAALPATKRRTIGCGMRQSSWT